MAILFAGTQGLLDDVEVPDLRAFEDGFYPYLETSAPSILTDIATKKALDDDIKSRLTAAVKDFKAIVSRGPERQEDAAAKEMQPRRRPLQHKAAPAAEQPAPAMAGSK